MQGQIWPARSKTHLKRLRIFCFPYRRIWNARTSLLENLKKLFKSVKYNKTAGHDDIDSNVIIKVCDEISDPLFIIFHSSFNEDIFPEQLKIAKVSPILKVGNIEEIGNHRPISVGFQVNNLAFE